MRFPYHGAGIGLILNGRMLLGKRSDHPFNGQWSVPGGSREKDIDKDELANAVREFGEETGVDFPSLKTEYLGRWTLRVPCFSWTTFFYRIDSFDQKLIPHEFYELQWIALEDILSKADKKKHFRPFTGSEVRKALKLI